ncbi:MAG TPA: hypothetical protein VEQ60_18740 [Longimicrobium sp.]|nr:hypothetical protein [Longimicrobium sp.]
MNEKLIHDSLASEMMAGDRDDVPEFEARLTEALTGHQVAFALLWTRGITLLISSLSVRRVAPSPTSWRQALTQQWMDEDGQFSHPLGIFSPGDRIEVMIAAMPMTANVPKAVAAVVIEPGQRVVQIVPAETGTTDSMKQGEVWARKGAFTV